MKEYFSHDYSARSDEKIIALLFKLNWEGYGIFWGLVEKIYEHGGELKPDYEHIAFDMRTQCERIKSVVNDFGLFYFSKDGGIRSRSIDKRLEERAGKSKNGKFAAKMRWNKENPVLQESCERNANAYQMQCDSNAIKVKERKVKESKEKEYTTCCAAQNATPTPKIVNRFQKPTLEEVKAYCSERKNTVNPERWFSYYEANGWKVGKNSMKDWKAAIRTWEQSEKKNNMPEVVFNDKIKSHVIVRGVKVLLGVDENDLEWDKHNLATCIPSAEKILSAFGGDGRAAALWMDDFVSGLKSKGYKWTIDTLAKNAWIRDRG